MEGWLLGVLENSGLTLKEKLWLADLYPCEACEESLASRDLGAIMSATSKPAHPDTAVSLLGDLRRDTPCQSACLLDCEP
jgi:hypothetical protein